MSRLLPQQVGQMTWPSAGHERRPLRVAQRGHDPVDMNPQNDCSGVLRQISGSTEQIRNPPQPDTLDGARISEPLYPLGEDV